MRHVRNVSEVPKLHVVCSFLYPPFVHELHELHKFNFLVQIWIYEKVHINRGGKCHSTTVYINSGGEIQDTSTPRGIGLQLLSPPSRRTRPTRCREGILLCIVYNPAWRGCVVCTSSVWSTRNRSINFQVTPCVNSAPCRIDGIGANEIMSPEPFYYVSPCLSIRTPPYVMRKEAVGLTGLVFVPSRTFKPRNTIQRPA